MKKQICILLALLCATACSIGVFADSILVPLWDNAQVVDVQIDFSGTKGSAAAKMREDSLSAKFTGKLAVYRKAGSGWIFVDHVYDTSANGVLALHLDFTGTSGTAYKAELTATATLNGDSEPISKTAYQTCP